MPTYGGTMTISLNTDISGFDDASPIAGLVSVNNAWQDALVADDWTLNPSVFSYQLDFRPSTYEVGDMASDWEFSTPNTMVINIRQGINWQNIAPVNGREFVASDVIYHYDRLCGLGDGFTKFIDPNSAWTALQSVSATGSFTVSFTWNGVSEESICETMQGGGSDEYFEAPEAVQQYGNLNNWHDQIGTGPFILSDWVDDSAMTLTRNMTYWGTDERYPQNQLPYINQLSILIIPNQSTALAAVRTGKLDVIDSLTLQQEQQLLQTDPILKDLSYPGGGPATVDPKDNITPFSDIRVRQAMQMSLDLATIAKTYYDGSAPPYPSTMTSMYMSGWTYPYTQWPASLQATYAYNPTGAKALLAAAGYPNGFNTSIVAATNSDLGLLQIVQSEFASVGITMSISTMDPASFNAYVRALKVPALNWNTSLGFTFPPLFGFRRWQTGADTDWMEVNDSAWNSLYAQALAATTVSATQQLVVQGNEYEAQQQWCVSLPTPSQFAVYQPWLNGYNAQTFSVSGSAGILWIGFYCSRFWINQSLKQSSGF
jgi:peptide/nickel transport system substrate-binding protein